MQEISRGTYTAQPMNVSLWVDTDTDTDWLTGSEWVLGPLFVCSVQGKGGGTPFATSPI